MAHKIHLRGSTNGLAVCAYRPIGNGKVRKNNRSTYSTIPVSHQVDPETFRATASSDRCAHCSDKFLETLNRRRASTGKPLYANVWTKELAQ